MRMTATCPKRTESTFRKPASNNLFLPHAARLVSCGMDDVGGECYFAQEAQQSCDQREHRRNEKRGDRGGKLLARLRADEKYRNHHANEQGAQGAEGDCPMDPA